MQFDVTIALTWILFLAIFPMAFFWFRRAWRIFVKKDYSEVALKKGEPPSNPQKYAPRVGLLNLIAGCVAVTIIGGQQ
jgi:ABC-type phosphate transport system permease subunit